MKLRIDGREAYAYTGGKAFDAALPTVVFVHGALNDHSVWTMLARWCANHGHSALAVDLPGHMRSAGPPLADIGAMADWTLALLDAVGVQQAVLAGHSMGTLVALEAAARAPGRVRRLLLYATAVPMPVPAVLLDAARDDPTAAVERVVTYSFAPLFRRPSYQGPGKWQRGAGRALMHRVLVQQHDPSVFHTDFAACDAYRGGLDAAARVECPVHLALGREDQMTVPRAADALLALLRPRVPTHVQLLDCGHAMLQEDPEGTLAALRAALAAPAARETATATAAGAAGAAPTARR